MLAPTSTHFPSTKGRRGSLLAVLGLLVMLTGCGEKKTTSVPVQGTAHLKQKNGKIIPLAGARVVLIPTSDEEKIGAYPTAIVSEDGSFHLGMETEKDGAPEGEHIVLVEWRKPKKVKYNLFTGKDGTTPGEDRLKGAYANRSTSKLRATVKAGEVLKIEIREP